MARTGVAGAQIRRQAQASGIEPWTVVPGQLAAKSGLTNFKDWTDAFVRNLPCQQRQYGEDFEPAETLGHAAAEYAIGLAVAAGARQVLLLHHRPDRTDSELEKLATGLRNRPVPVALAADGEVMCL